MKSLTKMKLHVFVAFIMLTATVAFSQNPAFEVTSTSGGFVAPSMNLTQRNAIVSPTAGSLVYNTTDNQYNVYNGTTWQVVIAGGVSSFSGGSTGLTPASATTGDISLAGTLGAGYGGTGLSTYAVGDLLYASAATTISKLADVAAGSYLRSGGVTTAPVWSTLTLPNAATTGDILYASASNTVSSLTAVAAGKVLTSAGTSTAPAYSSTPTLGIAGTTLGTLSFAGNTSGTVTIKPQATAGTYNFNLPVDAGTSGQVLTSGGGSAAAMTWKSGNSKVVYGGLFGLGHLLTATNYYCSNGYINAGSSTTTPGSLSASALTGGAYALGRIVTSAGTFSGANGWIKSGSTATVTASVYKYTPVSGGAAAVTGTLINSFTTSATVSGNIYSFSVPPSATAATNALAKGDIVIIWYNASGANTINAVASWEMTTALP